MAILLKNVRLSYPSLFKASAYGDAEPKFGATFLIEKDSDTHKALVDEIRKVATAAFGDKAKAILTKQDSGQRKLVKDGDGPDGQNGEGESKGYEGCVFIKASNKAAPKVVDTKRRDLTEADGIPYAGCFVNVQIDLWAQNNKFGQFINCKLLAVQHWADGEAFGTASRADINAFDMAEDEGSEW